MCTAAAFRNGGTYFGRTLDNDVSFNEEVVIAPRNFPFYMRHRETLSRHYAIIGMASVIDGCPLYYDGCNEKGLAMAGLNFVGNAFYTRPAYGRENTAQFELIPLILGSCATVSEARELIARVTITDAPFNEHLPPAQLHWLIADGSETITVEAVKEGVMIYDNPVGVLTNNPPFLQQLHSLSNYMTLSPRAPQNNFSRNLGFTEYSRGMGAIGLPGDLSSQSRFVRAAFTLQNAVSAESSEECVNTFFHILGTVSQTKGCCDLGNGKYETTLYTSCCDTQKGIYYYTTYENHSITAVDMHCEELNGSAVSRFPVIRREQTYYQNKRTR